MKILCKSHKEDADYIPSGSDSMSDSSLIGFGNHTTKPETEIGQERDHPFCETVLQTTGFCPNSESDGDVEILFQCYNLQRYLIGKKQTHRASVLRELCGKEVYHNPTLIQTLYSKMIFYLKHLLRNMV